MRGAGHGITGTSLTASVGTCSTRQTRAVTGVVIGTAEYVPVRESEGDVQLPETPGGGMEIGISDILGWRECADRMAEGMRRHVTLPDGTKDEPPGHINWTTAYGSAAHDAIHLVVTEGLTNDEAIARVWSKYGSFLDPEELALLREDLDAFRADVPLGFELIASEVEMRVPLFVYEGRQVYFRFRLDQLYRRIDDPTAFLEVDFKSSRHRKTQAEVDRDIKVWSYNFAIYEMWPEARSLVQRYDQLRFGTLTTSKNREQRAQIKVWLIETIKAILADDKLEPKQNPWCPWCPKVVTCPVTERSSRYWKGRLAVLAPQVKEGRKVKIAFLDEGEDLERMMTEVLPGMVQTRKHLEAVEKALKDMIADLPSEDRTRLGWRLSDRKTRVLTPDGLRQFHEAVGDSFYEMISLARSAAEGVIGKPAKGEEPAPQLQLLRELELEKVSSVTVVPKD